MEAFSITQVFKDSEMFAWRTKELQMARLISVKSAPKKSEITCLFGVFLRFLCKLCQPDTIVPFKSKVRVLCDIS